MGDMKTAEEIQAEIDRLKEMKPTVRRFDTFGGDNHAKIDAELDVLEERMDEDEIYDRWSDEDDPEINYDLISSARYAMAWMMGDEEDPPSKGWEALVEKT
jgi:hypothetical protein